MLEVNRKFYDGFFSQFETSLAFAQTRHMPAIKFTYVDWWDIKEENKDIPFDTKVYKDTHTYHPGYECFIDVYRIVGNKLAEVEKALGKTIELNFLGKYYYCTLEAKLADTVKNHTCKIISTGKDCTYPLLIEVTAIIYLRDIEFLNNEDYQKYEIIAKEEPSIKCYGLPTGLAPYIKQ